MGENVIDVKTNERQYKYKIKAEDLKKLIIAQNEWFENIKSSLLFFSESTEGIDRLSPSKIKSIYDIKISGQNLFTCIYETEVVGDLDIKEESELSGLLFYKSKINNFEFSGSIKDGVYLKDTKTADFYFFKGSEIQTFNISNCFTQNFYLLNNVNARSFIVKDNSIVGTFFVFGECNINEFFINKNSSVDGFQILNSNIKKITIKDNCTVGDFFVNNSKTENIEIENNCDTGDFTIQNSNIYNFNAINICSSFRIFSSNITRMNLFDCFISEFEVGGGCRIELYVKSGQLNKLDFRDTALAKDTFLSFSCLNVFNICMEDFSMLGNLYFRQIKSANKLFEWFEIDKRIIKPSEGEVNVDPLLLKVYETRKDLLIKQSNRYNKKNSENSELLSISTFRILQSSLGKTEFSDCDLSGFNFEFNNSKIIDCFITGGTLPGEKDNKEKGDGICVFGEKKGSEKWHEQRASFFSQFKSIFQAQGNISRATFFHSKWAEEQKSLFENKGGFFSFFDERFSLWLGKCSSNHGESWKKALRFLLFIPLFCYIPFLANMGILTVDNLIDWNMIFNYFEFLNPVHKPDFFDGKVIKGFAIPFDILGRIVSSYGIYQFILSFRKFSRK